MSWVCPHMAAFTHLATGSLTMAFGATSAWAKWLCIDTSEWVDTANASPRYHRVGKIIHYASDTIAVSQPRERTCASMMCICIILFGVPRYTISAHLYGRFNTARTYSSQILRAALHTHPAVLYLPCTNLASRRPVYLHSGSL